MKSNTKEWIQYSSAIAMLASAIALALWSFLVLNEVHGSVPGKSQSNNSGSDKRELYTIAQALQKPYHDLLYVVHNIIIRFNHWDDCIVSVPFVQLTTLNEHRDIKEVTIDGT